MSTLDLAQLLLGSGVLAQGWAAVRWVLRIETRVTVLEAARKPTPSGAGRRRPWLE